MLLRVDAINNNCNTRYIRNIFIHHYLMTTAKNSESAAKKNVTQLQRAIVDGLEDVKAQDIQVFNTEHLSALFERVIVASGTSNRQTKALASSVKDALKQAGFPKPRTEGEGNGEWIIVDCGSVVCHIMQPMIRQYYRLEEMWGEVPVRMKLGAAKPTPAAKAAKAKVAATAAESAPAKKPGKPKAAPVDADAPAKKPAAKKTAVKKITGSVSAKPAAKKPAAKKPAAKSTAAVKTVVVNKPKPAAKAAVKSAAKPAAKKPAAKRAPKAE